MMTEALERLELRRLVAEYADAPKTWKPLVRHDPDQRVFERLPSIPAVEAWLICWMPGHDTGFHDHDLSSGAVQIVQGTLREERLAWGGGVSATDYTPGELFDFSPHDIHRVVHPGGGPAVSIHVYSPRLRRMGAYAVGDAGQMQRHPMDYGEELRPLSPAG
jgi:predicted metal-dependent enzyme (double-stranded beta helix superfamily)